MKKTFLAKRNALLSSSNFSWGTYILLGAVIALLVRIVAPDIFWHGVAPVFRVADTGAEKIHAFVVAFGDTSALALRNEKLLDENAALSEENRSLLQKVSSLEKLIAPSQTEQKNDSGIIAGVVARPPTSPYDTLVLASGENAGIAVGQEVFGAGGVPVGVISSVSGDFSRVTLFSAPGLVMHGWVGDKNIPLTILGAGGGVMKASISRAAGVAVGDTVFVPGPGALPVGTISRVENDPSAPEIVLHIRPSLNPFSIVWVVVRTTHAIPLETAPIP